MEQFVRDAARQNADLVMFHESAVTGYVADIKKFAEYVPEGHSSQLMQSLARELDIYIGYGLLEKTRTERFHITFAFVGPQGFIYKYHKTWLWRSPDDMGYRNEWARFDPGTGPESFEIAGLKASCFICADGVAPRCLTRVQQLKPDIVFYPNNRSSYLPEDESISLMARQIGAPILVTNRVGVDRLQDKTGQQKDEIFRGGCAVFGSQGEVLAKAKVGSEQMLTYDLELPE
jgi:predicted amidohydrolase